MLEVLSLSGSQPDESLTSNWEVTGVRCSFSVHELIICTNSGRPSTESGCPNTPRGYSNIL